MKPFFRLIAIDLDGTLLDPAGAVSPKVAAAVARAAEAGVTVALATGRRHRSTKPVAAQVPASVFAILQHGALIKRTDDDRTVWAAPLDLNTSFEVAAFLSGEGLEPLILVDGYSEGIDFFVYGDRHPRGSGTLEWISASRSSYERVREPSDVPFDGVTEVAVLAACEKAETVFPRLVRRFGKELNCHLLKSPRYEHWFIEVMSAESGKGRALLELARRLGVKREETAAVGDDVNDLDMFEAAAVAVAMGNAPEEVRRAAEFVVAGNDRDGAAEAISRLLDGRPGEV
ncbi:MAG: HAD family hydrolase [Planctomycetota bacterium]|jgi:Cof subfamily protein (haloacid dehalogenase superfamily)